MLYPDVTMYITTYRRPNKQQTILSLPLEISREVYLVVRESELEAHRQWEPRCKEILVLPAEVDNFAKTRQWCFDHCKTLYIIFMDDDLKFYVRKDPKQWGMRRLLGGFEECRGMFDALVSKAEEEGVAQVAVSSMEFNRRYFGPWVNNTRYMRFYMYNTEIIRQEQIQISRMTMMLDFDTSLQLIQKGYPSWINYHYAQEHESSNAPGGCSEERNLGDPDGFKEAQRLKNFHPQFVEIVKKKTKESWGGKERYDVKIEWAKAYRLATQKKEPSLFDA